jgi:hypothetical protein
MPARDYAGGILSEVALRLPKPPEENMLKAKGIETFPSPML